MLQIGTTVRVKENAYEGSDNPTDFEVRGKVGQIETELTQNEWEVKIGDDWFILNSDELEEIEITEEIDPDTPRNREVLAAIRRGIETLGWEEFEQTLVEALDLYLVGEGDGQRHYEAADGQARITFSHRSKGQ